MIKTVNGSNFGKVVPRIINEVAEEVYGGVQIVRNLTSHEEHWSRKHETVGGENHRDGDFRERWLRSHMRAEFVERIRGFVPLYFVDFPFDHVVWPYRESVISHDLGLAAMMISLAIVSFCLWKIGVFMPLVFHSFIIYHQGPVLFPVFCVFTWCLSLIRKIFYRDKTELDLSPLFMREERMKNNSEYSIVHSYALIGFFVAVSVAAKFYPDWQLYSGCSVFLLMIHLLKVVPGVGAHSTTGIIGILLIFIIAVYCSPGALDDFITPITCNNFMMETHSFNTYELTHIYDSNIIILQLLMKTSPYSNIIWMNV